MLLQHTSDLVSYGFQLQCVTSKIKELKAKSYKLIHICKVNSFICAHMYCMLDKSFFNNRAGVNRTKKTLTLPA